MGLYRIECATSHPNGIAEKGDIFYISLNLCKYDSPLFGEKVDYIIKRGWDRPLEKGQLEINPGKNFLAIPIDKDGTYQCNFTYSPADSDPLTCGAGVAVNMEDLKLRFAKPDDYDDFWKTQLSILAEVAPEININYQSFSPQLLRGEVTAKSAYNSSVHAELFMKQDAAEKSLPAIIEFQGAGVRATGCARGVMRALDNFIHLEVLAHDVPIYEKPEFYRDLLNSKFMNYWDDTLAASKADECYFVSMFLRAKRAVEIIKSLPQWDGKNIIVNGGSQGGWQSLAAAALDKDVSCAAVWVPAGCNIIEGNWPLRDNDTRDSIKARENEYKNVLPYIDSGYFIENLQIPITFHVSLCDTCCHSHGKLAAYNNCKSPKKELHIYSQMAHEEHSIPLNYMYNFIKKNLK